MIFIMPIPPTSREIPAIPPSIRESVFMTVPIMSIISDMLMIVYYDLKFKEVNVGQHKRALALTARKLVRLVFRLLKDNRLYIP
jgi:hypothetical protein